MPSRPSEPPETTLDRIMDERRAKARALREAGSDPYRNDIGPAIALAEVRARYEVTRPPPANSMDSPLWLFAVANASSICGWA